MQELATAESISEHEEKTAETADVAENDPGGSFFSKTLFSVLRVLCGFFFFSIP
jgi:hypothetical protein